MRLCDVHLIPLATHLSEAEIIVHGLKRGDLNWRTIVKDKQQKDMSI